MFDSFVIDLASVLQDYMSLPSHSGLYLHTFWPVLFGLHF